MSAVLGVVGLVLIVLVVLDLLWTTVAPSAGGGPLTAQLSFRIWGLVVRWGKPRVLQLAGVVVTASVIMTWLALLLLGWYLIFTGDPEAVVSASTGLPADAWSRLYFTGFTVFTLGIGDYVPSAPLWQVATVVATATGLSLVTLAITYLLSVIQSVTQRRALAAQITAMGMSPATIIDRAWNGEQLMGLESALQSLIQPVAQTAQQHLAFPVLHYFHSVDHATAFARSIAVVDEVLTVIEHGMAPEYRVSTLTTQQLRDGVSQVFILGSAVDAERLGESTSAPPVPDLTALRRAGVPLVDDDQWHRDVERLDDRRRALRGFVALKAWDWDSVWSTPEG